MLRRPLGTTKQFIAILMEAEAGEAPVNADCRRRGISEQAFYRGQPKFGGMSTACKGKGCAASLGAWASTDEWGLSLAGRPLKFA